MTVNLFLALVGALGMYLIFLGLYSFVTVRLERGSGGLLYDETFGDDGSLRGNILTRLDSMLYQARFDVSVGEFLTISVILAVVTGVVLFLASGALAALVIGMVSGGLLYYLYLENRRTRNLDQYEAALPNALRDMRTAFRSRGLSTVEALRYVAEQGPDVCQTDFEELAAAFSGASVDYARLQRLLGLRGSYALDRVAEALIQFSAIPQRIPEILDLLIPRLRKEVSIRREMRANIAGPRRELTIVAVMPFALVLFFRVVAPEYAAFYSTAIGQVLLVVAFLIDAAVFVVANLLVRRIVDPVAYKRTVPERRRPAPAGVTSPVAAPPVVVDPEFPGGDT